MYPRHFATIAMAAATGMLVAPTAATATSPTTASTTSTGARPVTVTLTLSGRQAGGIEPATRSLSTPDSPSFRRFLDRRQLRDRFGANPAQIARVSAWARKAGFTVRGIDSTGSRLTIAATSAAASAAFGVTIGQITRGGVTMLAANRTPRPPAAVASDIRAVTGLNPQPARPLHISAHANLPDANLPGTADHVTAQAQYCSRFWGDQNNTDVPQRYPTGRQSNQVCGYNGPQLRALNALAPGDRGQGQTVVIVGAYNSPTTLADANATFAKNGVPALTAGQYQVKTYNTGGGDAQGCDVDSWHVEQALDVQAVHTIAPDAKIVYAAAADCTQLENTLAGVIADQQLSASIVSNSWAIIGAEPDDQQYLDAVNALLARAAILGVGTYFGSGDAGDNSTLPSETGPSVSFPASSPWTTAVGGTTSALGATNNVLFQTGWEDAANRLDNGQWRRLDQPVVGGAGGGSSAHFDKPTWQNTLPGARRAVPDIAALADPYTGLLVGATIGGKHQTIPVGGTSLATPIVAATTALAQARAGADSDVGLLTPVLYAKKTAGTAVTVDVQHVDAGVWTPVVPGDLPDGDYLIDVDAGAQTLKTAPGWDPVTGLGTPGPAYLTDITR